MKGIICEKLGDPLKVADGLPIPEPGPDQLLVKSLYTAINPVDAMITNMGLFVDNWPTGVGCDASGVVEKVGQNAAEKFKVGDYICGCTRLGIREYGTAQEYFLMDAAVAIPKPSNLTAEEAATIGVGVLTAALGVFYGLHVKILDPERVVPTAPNVTSETAIVCGGSGFVGRFAVQLLKASGFRVIASCSQDNVELVSGFGAFGTFDYKKSIDEQVQTVLELSGGNIHRVFDASASGEPFARALFAKLSEGPKYFTTVNDWSGFTDFEGGNTHLIRFGPVGRPEAVELNEQLSALIPVLVTLFEKEVLLPGTYDMIGKGGIDDILNAYEYYNSKKSSANKVISKIWKE